MNELSERARELAEKLAKDDIAYEPFLPCTRVTAIASLIEQALLAEHALARRDAMEEAAKIADGMSEKWTNRIMTDEHTRGMADGADFVAVALRAAAEKEVK